MNVKLSSFSDEEIVAEMIYRIGEDFKRPGLEDTPKRIVKMWKEIYRGYDETQKPIITTFKNGVDGFKTDEMIKDTGTFYSTCEHHFLPFFGRYWFAYIPNPKGKILGLSKVARLVDFHSAKLQVQERLVHDIVVDLYEALGKPKPLAMGLVMEAEHLCKSMRGVKKKGKMRTTKLIGTFKTDSAARAEFLDWVNNQ